MKKYLSAALVLMCLSACGTASKTETTEEKKETPKVQSPSKNKPQKASPTNL